MFQFYLAFLVFIIGSCTHSIEKYQGIIDPNFTQANVTQHTNTKQPQVELLFKPNIFSIPTNSHTNKYMISFVIKQSNFGDPSFIENINIFIFFDNRGSIENPLLYYTGMTIKNCSSHCTSIITNIQNSDGVDITDIKNPVSISRNIIDDFFTIMVLLDPSHIGEKWEAMHGYPGDNIGITQILYPFYRVKFSV